MFKVALLAKKGTLLEDKFGMVAGVAFVTGKVQESEQVCGQVGVYLDARAIVAQVCILAEVNLIRYNF